MTDAIKQIRDAANAIAEEANKCCYRSNGYEEDLSNFVEAIIFTLISQLEAEQPVSEPCGGLTCDKWVCDKHEQPTPHTELLREIDDAIGKYWEIGGWKMIDKERVILTLTNCKAALSNQEK